MPKYSYVEVLNMAIYNEYVWVCKHSFTQEQLKESEYLRSLCGDQKGCSYIDICNMWGDIGYKVLSFCRDSNDVIVGIIFDKMEYIYK